MGNGGRTAEDDKGLMRTIPYGHQTVDDKDVRSVVRVLESDWLTQGPMGGKFEEALCEYTGAKYAVCVSSGTAALHLACLAAGISAGQEVITSPMTFVASANCILYCNAKPVFADVEGDTANIDPSEIEKKINKKTSAIIPVHFAGHPCDLYRIKRIAGKHNLTVIEDAAHALGAEYKGSRIGACEYSDMAILSFHPVKSITTGEGGAVLTNRKDLYERLLLFRNHGITKDRRKLSSWDGPWYYQMQELGFNYRISDIQCALGISQLKKISSFIKKRKAIADKYREALAGVKNIQLPVERPGVRSSWHIFPIRVKHPAGAASYRHKVFEFLRANNIGVQVHYIPVYSHPYYQKLGYGAKVCPNAESFYRSEISIPIYPAMTSKQVGRVISILMKALARS